MIETAARSLSRPVEERLRRGPCRARVRAVFGRACHLRDSNGELLALVLPELDDGPLNLVVHGGPGLFDTLAPGMPAASVGGRLRVGPLAIDLSAAAVWEPRPDWPSLRARRELIATQLPFLCALCLEQAPAGSLLALTFSSSENKTVRRGDPCGRPRAGARPAPTSIFSSFVVPRRGVDFSSENRPPLILPRLRGRGVPVPCGAGGSAREGASLTHFRPPHRGAALSHGEAAHSWCPARGVNVSTNVSSSQPGDRFTQRILTRARQAVAALLAGPQGWRQGVLGLAGLGGGLTPAGDDWLNGLMLWAWLAHPAPARFGRHLVALAAPRTGALSAAFLRAAARGECSAPWQRLLAALSQGERTGIASAAQAVLARGATSGADTLAGFLGGHLVLQATL